MNVKKCPGCRRLLPTRAVQRVVELAGTIYRVCGAQCAKTLHDRLAEVILQTNARRAYDRRPFSVSGLATAADRATADGVNAAWRMSLGAAPIDHTGPPAPPRKRPQRAPNPVMYCVNMLTPEEEAHVSKCPCCDGLGVAARCTSCEGLGYIIVRSQREAELAHVPRSERCEVCHGHGFFPLSADLIERLGFKKEPRPAGIAL